MKCPLDGSALLVAHRSGIEIDTCPECRGVWLDRGELNKLIALATSPTVPLRPPSISPHRRRSVPPLTPTPPATALRENWLADVFDDTPTAPGEHPNPAQTPD